MATPKRGLGKGLSALIPARAAGAAQPRPEGVERHIKIGDIRPSPFQPRLAIRDESLKELADSIREKGVIEPVIVRRTAAPGYELIAGERRFRAAKKLGLAEIPAIVRQATDQESMELGLIENLQRENLNPLEEARGYQRLMGAFSLTQEQLSQKVGRERATVANSLRLLTLPEEIQLMIEDDRLTAGHARALLMVADRRQQLALSRLIATKGLSVREAESRARGERAKMQAPGGRGKARQIDQHLSNIQAELQRALGTKVRIKPQGKTKGRIEIEYFSVDDFERILAKMNVRI